VGLLNIKTGLVRLNAHEVNIKAKRKKGSFAALRMTGEERILRCAQDDELLQDDESRQRMTEWDPKERGPFL